jgi:hypothetical protein
MFCHLVWFCGDNCCGCCCCGCNGNWKKGNPPLPREYGICPFHLLIDCHCRFAADRGAAQMTGKPVKLANALMKMSGSMHHIPTKDLRHVEGHR